VTDANYQVHRRPFEPDELLFFATECDARGDHLLRQGRREEAASLAELGLELLELAKRGRPVSLPLLWYPETRDFRLVGQVAPTQLDGLAPHDCPETCRCRRQTLEPTRRSNVNGFSDFRVFGPLGGI